MESDSSVESSVQHSDSEDDVECEPTDSVILKRGRSPLQKRKRKLKLQTSRRKKSGLSVVRHYLYCGNKSSKADKTFVANARSATEMAVFQEQRSTKGNTVFSAFYASRFFYISVDFHG